MILALMGDKHSSSDQAINNSRQSACCFRSMEGSGVIRLAVELKYPQPFTKIADSAIKFLGSECDLFEVLKATTCPCSVELSVRGFPVDMRVRTATHTSLVDVTFTICHPISQMDSVAPCRVGLLKLAL